MVWRSIVISQPAKLKREHFALVIEQAQSARVPFEDIAVIVLNNREITLTHPVLSACADYGIALYSTGDNHQPNGVFTAFQQHSRNTRWLRLQLDLARPTAKQTWAAIVKSKISNQAECLRLAHLSRHEDASLIRLQSYTNRVRSGDPENLEAQAAAYYFPILFGKGFHRAQTRFINAALDYGYAIVRGAIARNLVAHGLLPAIGIFHASEQNAFNLADDIIEPFRAIVDLCVFQMLQTNNDVEDLRPQDKVQLIGILNMDMKMPRGTMSVLSAIEHCVESLARIYDGGSSELIELPILIGLQTHQLEF